MLNPVKKPFKTSLRKLKALTVLSATPIKKQYQTTGRETNTANPRKELVTSVSQQTYRLQTFLRFRTSNRKKTT